MGSGFKIEGLGFRVEGFAMRVCQIFVEGLGLRGSSSGAGSCLLHGLLGTVVFDQPPQSSG